APKRGEIKVVNVVIEDRPTRRLAGMAHHGAYHEIGNAFQKIAAIFSARGLWQHAGPMLGIYYDDPSTTQEALLKSHAGITVSEDFDLPEGLEDIRVTGGRTAICVHKGPYADLPETWNNVYGTWLPSSGEEPAALAPYEVYLNDPMTTAPEDLLTEICVPLKA
ncbi:MAG: GyrI-like domain-containing protein, partial [Pseudomonadota bacterium]